MRESEMKMGPVLLLAVVCPVLFGASCCASSSEKASTADYLAEWNVREDWSKYKARFPYDLSTVMKEGRPVLYIPFGKWIGHSALASQNTNPNPMFSRYVAKKMMGDAFTKSRSMSLWHGTGTEERAPDFDVFLNLEAAMGYENVREEFQTMQDLLGVNSKYSSHVYGFSLINFAGITFNLSSWEKQPRNVMVLADRCDDNKKRAIILDYFGEKERNLHEDVWQSCWGRMSGTKKNGQVEHEKHQEL